MKSEEYQAFAAKCLDLWQEQMTRAMNEGEMLQFFTQQMQQWQQQAEAFSHEQTAPKGKRSQAGDPAHASGAGADELADLRQRLAACERKIIKLEAALERSRATEGATGKKPASKRAGVAGKAGKRPAKAATRNSASKRAVKRK